jgi:hypothetical protein
MAGKDTPQEDIQATLARLAQAEPPEPPPAPEPAPPPPRYYRVLMPNEGFHGRRWQFEFHHGEAIIPADARVDDSEPRATVKAVTPRLAIDMFRDHLHYRVEPIPFGEPPLPRRNPVITPA